MIWINMKSVKRYMQHTLPDRVSLCMKILVIWPKINFHRNNHSIRMNVKTWKKEQHVFEHLLCSVVVAYFFIAIFTGPSKLIINKWINENNREMYFACKQMFRLQILGLKQMWKWFGLVWFLYIAVRNICAPCVNYSKTKYLP